MDFLKQEVPEGQWKLFNKHWTSAVSDLHLGSGGFEADLSVCHSMIRQWVRDYYINKTMFVEGGVLHKFRPALFYPCTACGGDGCCACDCLGCVEVDVEYDTIDIETELFKVFRR